MGEHLQFIASLTESFSLSGFLIAIAVGGLVVAAVISALTGELYASDVSPHRRRDPLPTEHHHRPFVGGRSK